VNSRMVITNSCLILVLGLFSIDLYNPALPEIARVFSVTDAQSQNLVVFYLAGFALSQLVYGPISDRKGRVPVIMVSLALGALGNYLTSTADSIQALYLFRLLTGIGAGGCPVISRAILSDTFKDKTELSKSLTVFSMASQVSPALAPVLGGFITAALPWQYNFYALTLITLLGAVFIKATLVETAPLQGVPSKRLEGFKVLLRDFNFMVYSLVSAVLFAITIGYFTASPFIYQLQFHLQSQENGLLFVGYSAGIVLGSYLTKRFLNRYSPERILMTSLVALTVLAALAPLVLQAFKLVTAPALVAYGFLVALGCGLSSPLLLGISLHGQAKHAGTGSALQGAIKMAGAALALFFFSEGHTSTAMGLMMGILVMSLFCLFAIALAQRIAGRSVATA
jgi:DHA1 family bicyclomycin/chloramphenicol resistance-like MFS transporter